MRCPAISFVENLDSGTPVRLGAASCAAPGLEKAEPAGPDVRHGISSNAYIFVHVMHNPEREFLDPYWDEVWSAFKESELAEEIKAILAEMAGAHDAEAVESAASPYLDLLGAVDWGAFIEDEFAFGVEAGFPQHIHTAVVRMPAEKASANLDALAALFDAVARLDQSFSVERWNRGAARAVTLDFGNPWVALKPTIACDGEIFVASTVKERAETALDLVFGQPAEAQPMVGAPAFKETLALLPVANDSVFYFEPAKIFHAYDNITEWQGVPRDEISVNIGSKRHAIDELMHLIHPYVVLAERMRATFNRWTGAAGAFLDRMSEQAADPGAPAAAQIFARFRIELVPVAIEGLEDGKKLAISILPFVQPVVGFHGDQFVAASSETGLKTYLRFLQGEGPDILKNDEFAGLDLEVPEHLHSISFQDLGAGCLLPMVGQVVAEMDFIGYQASSKAYEPEAEMMRTRMVTTYRVDEESDA